MRLNCIHLRKCFSLFSQACWWSRNSGVTRVTLCNIVCGNIIIFMTWKRTSSSFVYCSFNVFVWGLYVDCSQHIVSMEGTRKMLSPWKVIMKLSVHYEASIPATGAHWDPKERQGRRGWWYTESFNKTLTYEHIPLSYMLQISLHMERRGLQYWVQISL